MVRLGTRRLWFVLIVVVIVLLTGGYFGWQAFRGDTAGAVDTSVTADSTADTTRTEPARKPGGKKDKKKKGKDEKKEPDPVPVEVATVLPREISAYYYTTATLEPERKVIVLAKTAGEIAKIYAEEGATIGEGAVLCQIEDSEPRVALDEARINLERQEREFERIKTMFDERLVSDREFSDVKYQHEVAKNQHEAALLRHEYTKVRAPFTGVVTQRFVEVGQNVGVGAQLFEIADTDPLLVRMYLPEGEVGDIKVGQEVTIEPDKDPGVILSGRVVRIAPAVDERTGTVKVTAETAGGAMPGSFARIRVVTDTRRGSLAIPRRGLISDSGDLFVYVAEADTVRKAPVHIGYQDEEYAEIRDGVEEGDSVVVVGVGALRTGTKVKILDARMQQTLSQQEKKKEDETQTN